MISGVVFDLEGTCIDLEPYHFAAYAQILSLKGFVMTPKEIAAIPGVIGGGSRFIVEVMSKRFPETDWSDFSEQKKLCYESMLTKAHIQPREGLLVFLELLKGRNMPMVMGSRTPRKQGEWFLKVSGLDAYFKPHQTVFLEDVYAQKPAPDCYLKTAEILRITPEEQLVFEDSVHGVVSAIDAGSSVIAVPSPLGQTHEHIASLKEAGVLQVYDSWERINEAVLDRLLSK